MINQLLLLSGNEIPFKQARLIVHQPIVKDIAYIGEQNFFTGCQYLNFSKENLKLEDKLRLQRFNDFKILMTMMKDDNTAIQKNKICMQLVLSLLFPYYKINFLPMSIMLSKKNQNNEIERYTIDENNFFSFKQIINQIFCLTDIFKGSINKYNPGGVQAQALVQKFEQRQKKLAALKNQGDKKSISILAQYISILAVGQNKDMNQLLQYTVYQLFNEYRRFKMKLQFDINLQARMAGAQNLEEAKNWMGDLNSSDTL